MRPLITYIPAVDENNIYLTVKTTIYFRLTQLHRMRAQKCGKKRQCKNVVMACCL